MSKRDEQRQLVKIATLYYVDGLKQSEIAKTLDLSQSFVSRSITRCLNEGYVKISVIQPSHVFLGLESQLQKRFNITQAIVVDVPDSPSEDQIKQAIGSAAAHYLQTSLRPNDLVGVSAWSGTISAMVNSMHPLPVKAKGVIQLLGGVGPNGNIQATLLTHSLANMLNCKPSLLPSQSIERSIEAKKQLMASNEVAEVVEQFSKVDLAIVGIGMLEPSVLLKNSGNYHHKEMLNKLAQKGAVGDICLHYYNEKGEAVLSDEEDPVIGMPLAQVKNCPRVVALAGGLEKKGAILGALVGGYIDVLVTDRLTAETLLMA